MDHPSWKDNSETLQNRGLPVGGNVILDEDGSDSEEEIIIPLP